MKLLTQEQAAEVIRKAIGKTGQHEFAKANGISQAIISTSLSGARLPSPALLDVVGLEKVPAYRRKEE